MGVVLGVQLQNRVEILIRIFVQRLRPLKKPKMMDFTDLGLGSGVTRPLGLAQAWVGLRVGLGLGLWRRCNRSQFGGGGVKIVVISHKKI